MKKQCTKHGITEYAKEKDRYRCKQCRAEALVKRRHKLKTLSVEYKGGCCQRCGYNKYIGALEFHHLDPNKKDFGLSVKGLTRAWHKVKTELDKCIMLCANCHREVHEEERSAK